MEMSNVILENNHDSYERCRTDLIAPKVLLRELEQLREKVVREGEEVFHYWQGKIVRPSFLSSALNLAHYLILRQHDLRPLQMALMPLGLSSLGRSESRVLSCLDAVISSLGRICRVESESLPHAPTLASFFQGELSLQQNSDDLFGPPFGDRRVRIMVTLPTAAATNYSLVRDLIDRGASCVRINCAHDSETEWQGMIENVRVAEVETGHQCKILMDLSGPKPRIKLPASFGKQLHVFTGDRVLLVKSKSTKKDRSIPQVQCTIPEVLDDLSIGQKVWIDDGKIEAAVEDISPQGVVLDIVKAKGKGSKLRSGKGLNLPEADLHISPLTTKDLKDLDYVVSNADIIGYSFVQTAADIELLQTEIVARLQSSDPLPGIIAKIETPRAVQNLPEIIVQAAGKQSLSIMIARGDLAIEIGYQRLAEMQEEILWICEASHIPVVWATQVLEQLVKKGTPSRAEMTDAAMAERAECVMLNKGKYIYEGVTFLNDVLTRMQSHQLKKTHQLRALQTWKNLYLQKQAQT